MWRWWFVIVFGAALLPGTARASPTADLAASLVGQTATVCNTTSTFTITVREAWAGSTLYGSPAAGGTLWVWLVADVKNTGRKLTGPLSAVNLTDNAGRVTTFASNVRDVPALHAIQSQLSSEKRAQRADDLMAGGATARVTFVFQVPADAKSLKVTSGTPCR